MFFSESAKQMQERDIRKMILPQVPTYHDDKGLRLSLPFSFFLLKQGGLSGKMFLWFFVSFLGFGFHKVALVSPLICLSMQLSLLSTKKSVVR